VDALAWVVAVWGDHVYRAWVVDEMTQHAHSWWVGKVDGVDDRC